MPSGSASPDAQGVETLLHRLADARAGKSQLETMSSRNIATTIRSGPSSLFMYR